MPPTDPVEQLAGYERWLESQPLAVEVLWVGGAQPAVVGEDLRRARPIH